MAGTFSKLPADVRGAALGDQVRLMLRVSIHAGSLRTISRFNRLDWLDIGYNELGPLATYKVVLFKIGEGVVPPVYLPSYPRWSSSLNDL